MLTYKQIKAKLESNDYDDLLEDLWWELQMYDQFKTIEEMVNDKNQDIANALCEDFPDRYGI